MPELPEIEHLRRTLEPHLVGARIAGVRLHRRGVVRIAGSRRAVRSVSNRALLDGAVVCEILRRGKSLAIVAADGRVLAAHMGMTGSLEIHADTLTSTGGPQRATRRDKHVHCEWALSRDGVDAAAARLVFRDPRRFGGLWPFASIEDLHARAWSRLGPDALTIEPGVLRERLLRTRQPIKAALLNQALVAGVGNIYADEALFAGRIHPQSRTARLGKPQWQALAGALRSIMRAAVESGGSTLRDYRDAGGRPGTFAFQHRVYGRGGEPCMTCARPLRSATIGQRTTVFCTRCQTRSWPDSCR